MSKKKHLKRAKITPAAAKVVLCSSLQDLLFTDFLKCSCENNFSSLIRAGIPTPKQLQDAWINLISEYNTLTASKQAEKHIAESSRMEALNTKIIVVTKLVEAVALDPAPVLIAELKAWGYLFTFSPATMEKDLRKVLAKLGNDKTKLAMAIKVYQDEHGKTNTPKSDKKSYMKILSAIEEKKKMELNLTTLTAYKFAILYNELVEYSNLIKSKYSGYGNK